MHIYMSIYVEHMCVVILAGDCSKKYICAKKATIDNRHWIIKRLSREVIH